MAGGEKETGEQVQNHSGVYDNAQCSQDLWKNSVNKSEWKEFSRELHEWASLKEKSHTWNKSCTDSSKGGGDQSNRNSTDSRFLLRRQIPSVQAVQKTVEIHQAAVHRHLRERAEVNSDGAGSVRTAQRRVPNAYRAEC